MKAPRGCVLVPALGGPVVGDTLFLQQQRREGAPDHHHRDYQRVSFEQSGRHVIQ
ncbi:MAG TPA: hypothetical protein VMU26_27940 [Candidatus Polarisedimenticolia bacterium]|nr:hypothetical protein [Candidatus Polarisedimenticolia bacterium]